MPCLRIRLSTFPDFGFQRRIYLLTFVPLNSQTSWWYLRFLASDTGGCNQAQWQRPAENLRELRVSEPGCKWIVIGILCLLHADRFSDLRMQAEADRINLWRDLRGLDLVRNKLYHSSFLSIA
jgi:hypothetical protein